LEVLNPSGPHFAAFPDILSPINGYGSRKLIYKLSFKNLFYFLFQVHGDEQNPPLPGLWGGILQPLLKLPGIERFPSSKGTLGIIDLIHDFLFSQPGILTFSRLCVCQ